ncbi:MAG: hypothetical protein ACI3XG_05145 [Faecousia sp.]
MKCLKCGRETDQTFCEGCREEMARYPVKPGTIVQLPKDRSASYTRRSQNWRAMISPETQIENQKRTIRRLAGAVAALVVLLVMMGIALFRVLSNSNLTPVGQNYSTVTKPTEDATAPTTGPDTSDTTG